MKRASIVFLGLLLAATGSIQAQGTGEVHGRVVESESDEPLAGASVAVWSSTDPVIVTGAIVREDGAFRIPGLQQGTYYLHITSIGYAPHKSADFTITPASPSAAMGTIELTASMIEADAIDVTVDRPTITIAPDRNSYVAGDVAPAAATASDVLQAVPSVQVDADGAVSLRGNDNVAVQINGRPAPLQGDQLGAYLQQLPASVIDRVEVIPTPSARYDPEGMAGIINIVMKENADLGLSGGLTVGAATAERYNLSAHLGYQEGPATLFTTYGFNSSERAIIGINDRVRHDPLGEPLSFTEQILSGETNWSGHNLSTTLDYRLSDRDVLTNALVLNRRHSTDASFNAYTELDASRSVLDRYARPREGDDTGLMLDYTLAFKRTLEPHGHELASELRFNWERDDERTDLWRQPAAGEGPRVELERDDVDSNERDLTARLDYTRPLGTSTKLELGYKGDSRWLEEDFLVLKDSLGAGEWTRSDLSNAFSFDEHVQAAYGVVSHAIGKFELQAGIRAEYARQEFILAEEGFPESYASLFPSGIASYSPSEATTLKLSYSRRINRPGTRQLNPFPRFFDTQTVFLGNPELEPEYTHSIELGFSRFWDPGSIQITPFYHRTTDVIRFIVDPEDEIDGREVTSVSFENLATGSSWGADVNGSLKLGRLLNGFASFNVYKMVTDGGSVTDLASNAVTWSARVNATANLTPSLSLQAMYFYRAPMEFERGRFGSWKMASFTLRQQLLGDKASVSLRVADPFDTMGFRVQANDGNITQITERDFDARALHLTFQYNFGKAPKGRQPRTDPNQEPQGGFPQ